MGPYRDRQHHNRNCERGRGGTRNSACLYNTCTTVTPSALGAKTGDPTAATPWGGANGRMTGDWSISAHRDNSTSHHIHNHLVAIDVQVAWIARCNTGADKRRMGVWRCRDGPGH